MKSLDWPKRRATQKVLAVFVTACLLISLLPATGFGFADDLEDSAQPSSPETEQAQGSGVDGVADDAGVIDAPASPEGVHDDTTLLVPLSDDAPGISPLSGEVASMTGSVTTSPTTPLSGADFKMVVEMNSISEGASTTEGVQNAKITFTIPSNVEIQSFPVSNGQFTVSPAKPQPGDKVTITYNNELSVGSLYKLECWFKFPAGVSLPAESFHPIIELTADNAHPYTMQPTEVNPMNNPLGTVMKVDSQDINPIFLHTAEIALTREATLGGLNQNNASVEIKFPGDAEVLSVTYDGVTYPVTDDGLGGKVATIPLGTLAVGDVNDKERITVLYSYPPMTTPGETDYAIDITYSATRFDGTPIVETSTINETVSYDRGGAAASAFFKKNATSQVYRTAGQAMTFELDFTPNTAMKGIVLTDDPIRAGETDFFDAIEYKTVTWTPYAVLDPVNGETVRTQMLYQVASEPGVWRSAGAPVSNGRVNIDGLGLAAGDYVTQVQFKFYGDNGDEIKAGSSPVKIRILGVTKSSITATGVSYDDNQITNGAYMTGSLRFPGSADYVAIEDNGADNVRTTTTRIVANNPSVGIAGWESPVSPNPILPGKEVSYNIRHYIENSVLRDVTSYIVVDPKIDILDVVLDSRFPDATYTVTMGSNGHQLVSIKWNGDITSPWTQYSVSVKGVAKPGIGSSAYFRYLVASDDPTQVFSGGGEVNTWWLNQWADRAIIEVIGGDLFGSTHRNSYPVDNGLGMNPQKQASIDGTNYALTQTIDTSTSASGETAYFSMNISNPESTNLEEVRIIDMLPTIGDSMTISDNAKKSTTPFEITGMTLSDGSALPASCQLFYSDDATATSNRAELVDFTNVSATWVPWDGASALPTTAKALRLVKTDGLVATESFGVRLQVTVPQNATGTTLVGWNSLSAGGKHAGGYIVPGEPHKSGIYVSPNPATMKLAGILWEDKNGNDLRDSGEPTYGGKAVRLYDWDDSLVSQTTTDSSGYYEFDGLLPERYRVEVDIPRSLSVSDYQVGSDRSLDSDFVRTDTYLAGASVNLATETHPLNIDAGFYTPASVGDYVWDDANGNGLQEVEEQGLAGVTVSLYRMDGSTAVVAGTKVTDAGGKYSFTELKPGTYVVGIAPVADRIPTEYAVGGSGATNDSKIKSTWETDAFTLMSGAARTDVDAGVRVQPDGGVTLTKVDENGAPLSGATFGIWADSADPDTDAPLKTATSGSDGVVAFSDMPLGDYQVKETVAPQGYVIESTLHAAVITNAQLYVDLGEVSNVLALGSVSLVKVDENGAPLSGATFGIWAAAADPEADTPLATAVSGADGVVIFASLPQAAYQVKEIAAPQGYVVDITVHSAVLNKTSLAVDLGEVSNALALGSVSLVKVDENGAPLAGATFGIWADTADPETDTPLATVTSGADGVITFEDRAQGSYVVKETVAPVGYAVSPTVHTALLSKTALAVDLGEVANSLAVGSIALVKVDEDGTPLSGAIFGIWTASADPLVDAPLATAVSASDGRVVFEDMAQGAYTVKEIMAPEGYILSDVLYSAEISRTELSVDLGSIENEKDPTVVPQPETSKPGASTGTVMTKTGDDLTLVTVLGVGAGIAGLLLALSLVRRSRSYRSR